MNEYVCNNCRTKYNNKTAYNRHLKTPMHQRMSKERYCEDCKEKIDQDEANYVIKCIKCYTQEKNKNLKFVELI